MDNDDNSFASLLFSWEMDVNNKVPKTAEEYDVSIHELPTFLFLEGRSLGLSLPESELLHMN